LSNSYVIFGLYFFFTSGCFLFTGIIFAGIGVGASRGGVGGGIGGALIKGIIDVLFRVGVLAIGVGGSKGL
jgi:hypothetical protein